MDLNRYGLTPEEKASIGRIVTATCSVVIGVAAFLIYLWLFMLVTGRL